MRAMNGPYFWRATLLLVALAVPSHSLAQDGQRWESLRGLITPREYARLTLAQRENLSKLASADQPHIQALTICWTEGTASATVLAFERALERQIGNGITSQLDNRWQVTATNGDGLTQGDPTTLTWSIIPDGMTIPGFVGETTSGSNLIAWLSSLYGVVSDNADYTDETWFPLFQQSFDRWAQLTGLTYVYEPMDDAAAFGESEGGLGQRGDVRIGGHHIDGNGGVLAYNFFPDTSDMVIDTSDEFFNNSTANSLRLRNVLMHESGHGIGIRHISSDDAQFLMEPFISSDFDGPQFDDILGGNRHYGDYEETAHANDTAVTATSLGWIAPGNTETRDLVSVDDDSDFDYYSFTVGPNHSVLASVTPQGFSYNQSSLGAGQARANPQSHGDLVLEILDTDGLNLLGKADNTGLGGSESVRMPLPGAGTYFVRVRHAQDQAQMYDLAVTTEESCEDCVAVICEPDLIVGNGFGGGSNFQRRLRFVNCGADSAGFSYSATDTQGWSTPHSGTATLAPGDTLSVKINFAVPGSTPGGTTSTLKLFTYSENCPSVADSCSTLITVDDTVPVAIYGMRAVTGDRSVELHWNVGENWSRELLGVQVQRADHEEGPYSQLGDVQEPNASMSYTDLAVQPERRYWYRLVSIALDGNLTTAPIEVMTSGFALVTQLHAPSLSRVRRVQIRYDLGRDSMVRLEIYDARGRRIRSLEEGSRFRGVHSLEWNGRDDSGALIARGVYFISLTAERKKFSRKVVLTH